MWCYSRDQQSAGDSAQPRPLSNGYVIPNRQTPGQPHSYEALQLGQRQRPSHRDADVAAAARDYLDLY